MGLGCFFTIVGYILATLSSDVTAQSESTIVDEIVCRKLKVVDHQDRTVAVLDGSLFSNDTFSIYNTSGNRVVRIGTNSDGGHIIVCYNVR